MNLLSKLKTLLSKLTAPHLAKLANKKNQFNNFKKLSGSGSMNRNVFHLFAAIASTSVLVFWLATGIAAVHHFDLRKINDPHFSAWITFLVITQLAAINAGILELIFNEKVETSYAGYLTIFASNMFFPPFVSFTFYMRSGLTTKKQVTQIRLYVIDFLSEFEAALKEQGIIISKETQKQIDALTALQKKNLLDTFNGNAYKLHLIEQEVPYNSWPKIWNDDEIVAIANDTPYQKTK